MKLSDQVEESSTTGGTGAGQSDNEFEPQTLTINDPGDPDLGLEPDPSHGQTVTFTGTVEDGRAYVQRSDGTFVWIGCSSLQPRPDGC